jgi:hypothetical protein
MESSETYATYGSNFDINFGTRSYIEPNKSFVLQSNTI